MPQRLFSSFPGGRHGFGLLLLRAAAGSTALVQGAGYLSMPESTVFNWLSAALWIVGGTGVLIGFVTPVSAAVLGVCVMATEFSWISPSGASNALHTPAALSLVLVVLVAIGLLGPGGFSLDRRLFGRREIIIPSTPRPRPR